MATKLSNKIFKKLNIDQKIELVHGKDEWNFNVPFSLLKKANFKVSDGPLGLRTINDINHETIKSIAFPSMATLSCSFDKDMLFDYGKNLALIAKANKVNAILGPGLNIKRNPLNGRNFEYLSEDPILSGKLAGFMALGIEKEGISSCLKHFVANNQESYRFVSSSNIDKKALNEIYLRNFNVATRISNPSMIMTSYNRLNRVRVNENRELLDDFRNISNFNGLYISDWSAINDPNLFFKSNEVEMPYSDNYLKINKDDIDIIKSIDKTSKEVLDTIIKFNKKYKVNLDYDKMHDLSSLYLANSTVLLKNENELLPLHPLEKILVVGSLANKPYFQGDGSSKVEPYNVDSFTDELDKLKINYEYRIGYDEKFKIDKKLIIDAVKDAPNFDKIILFIGNIPLTEKENQDRLNLDLPKVMEELFDQLYLSNKNIIVILETGSPVQLKFKDQIKCLILPYLGGEGLNKGLIYNLYGIIPPSGRLSETWPLKIEDSPIYESITNDPLNVNYLESIYVGYRYFDKACKNTLFSFGEGLSYSMFDILSFKSKINKKYIHIKAKIKNTGDYDSKTPILIYYSKENSNTFREDKSLIDFEKIYLKKNESKTVNFYIPYDDLKTYDFISNKMILEDGEYIFKIGFDSHDFKKEIKINIKSREYLSEDYNKLYKSYSKFKDNKFKLNDFNNIAGFEYFKEIRPITKDSILDELDLNEKSKKLKELILERIDLFIKDNPALKENVMAHMTSPIRILNSYFKLLSDEELESYLKIINE